MEFPQHGSNRKSFSVQLRGFKAIAQIQHFVVSMPSISIGGCVDIVGAVAAAGVLLFLPLLRVFLPMMR
jgi:hypothetical protein